MCHIISCHTTLEKIILFSEYQLYLLKGEVHPKNKLDAKKYSLSLKTTTMIKALKMAPHVRC